MSSTGYDYALNMINLGTFSLEKSLSQVFGRKIASKTDVEIISFLLRKVIAILR